MSVLNKNKVVAKPGQLSLDGGPLLNSLLPMDAESGNAYNFK